MAEFKKNWLGSEVGMVLKTVTIPQGNGVVKSGTLITDATQGKGLLFNDVDVTEGSRVASIMIRGSYIDANLPMSVAGSAEELAKQGLYAVKYPETVVQWGVEE